MISILCAMIGFLIGYNLGTTNVEKMVRREVERQFSTLSDWTLKDDN